MSALKLTIAGDGIAVVTLANPPINAMDAGLLEQLANLFEGLAADRAVRAAVIAADGPAFSAGLNLKTTPGLDRLGQRRLVDALNDGFGTLYAWPKPLVAAVNGHAIAGGLILALCADWRIVADVPMQISLAEVRVGVTYPVAPLAIARSELSPSAARRLILLGETVDAATAEALAIVRRARAGRGPAGARHRPGRAPRHAAAAGLRHHQARIARRRARAHRRGARRPRRAAACRLVRRGDAARLCGRAARLVGGPARGGVSGFAGRLQRAIVPRGGRPMTTIVRMLAAMALMLMASLAQAQNKVPSERALEALVKATLLTFNDANVTGNFTVFHAKLAKPFRQQFTPERLAGDRSSPLRRAADRLRCDRGIQAGL